MKRVLITGAAGFIGANLARRLARDGHDVHLTVRPGSSSWRIDSIRPYLTLREVDLADEASVTELVRHTRPDWIFHLATHGAYSSQTNLHQMVQANVVGTTNLVEAGLRAGFEVFVNTGSSSEYGFKDHPPLEAEALEPNSHYAVTKASATLFCRYSAQRHNVQIQTLRLYSVYGPYEQPTRLMPRLIVCGLDGELPPLVNPDIARDYVCIDDVIEAYLRVATVIRQEPGAIYNVGTGVQTSLRQVVEIAGRVLGVTPKPQWGSMPDRAWDTNVWVSDNRKIRRDLGWEPHFSIEQGFRLMVRWFQDNPAILRLYSQHH